MERSAGFSTKSKQLSQNLICFELFAIDKIDPKPLTIQSVRDSAINTLCDPQLLDGMVTTSKDWMVFKLVENLFLRDFGGKKIRFLI